MCTKCKINKFKDIEFIKSEYSDIFICTCKTGKDELTHILLDRNEHKYETLGIPKIAMNGQSTSQVFMDEVRVPVANTIGPIGAGLKNMEEALVPSIYDPSQIDETVMIETEDAFEMTRQLATEEGIFAGMSSGAAMIAAVETAKKANSGTIVVIFPDRGDRYLSTELFHA